MVDGPVKQTLYRAMNVRDMKRLGRVGQDFPDGPGDFADATWGRNRLAGSFGGFSEQPLSERVQTCELIGSSAFGKCSV
ncbi:MAG: hypothetical protein WBM00_08290 [Solirubrobacterales bacterium]